MQLKGSSTEQIPERCAKSIHAEVDGLLFSDSSFASGLVHFYLVGRSKIEDVTALIVFRSTEG